MPDIGGFIRLLAKIAIATPGTPGDFRRSPRSAYKIAKCVAGLILRADALVLCCMILLSYTDPFAFLTLVIISTRVLGHPITLNITTNTEMVEILVGKSNTKPLHLHLVLGAHSKFVLAPFEF